MDEIQAKEVTELKDFDKLFIFQEYEAGMAVSEIAAAMGKTAAFVYTVLRAQPEKYEDTKRVREEQHNLTLRRVRGLADKITQRYLEDMQNKLSKEDITDEEKEAIYGQIDQVVKIAKQYSERVNLAEGKATENIALNHNGKIPFEIIITKAYEQQELPASSGQLPEETKTDD